MKFLKKVKNKIIRDKWKIRAFLPSLIFNLRHLPFSQARKMPILIYKARLKNNSGKFEIRGNVTFGMIVLGKTNVSIFPSNGITIENRGTIIFNGQTVIGNDSALSLGEGARLEFGYGFAATCGLKIACYDSIIFEQNVLVGWNNMFIDTDFHKLKNIDTTKNDLQGVASIHIGHDTWLGNGCKVYKGVSLPAFCVVGADTILHKKIECPKYSLITNKRDVSIKYTGYYLDVNDKDIDFFTTVHF